MQRNFRPRPAAVAGGGSGLAELIAQGRYTTLDLLDLGDERGKTNRPLLDRNVI